MPNVIQKPIDTIELMSVLGEGLNDIGSLCKSANINKWSKYKPVSAKSIIPQDNIWKGDDGKCGIEIIKYNSLIDLKIGYDNKTDMYKYIHPSGGTLSPYRLTDFNGYNHEAKNPIKNVEAQDSIKSNETLTCTCIRETSNDFKLSDIKDLGTCYYGVALFDNNVPVYFRTSPYPISEITADYFVSFNIDHNLMRGEFSIIPFFTTIKNPDQSYAENLNGTWYGLPITLPNNVSINDSDDDKLILDTDSINRMVTIVNHGTITVDNVKLDLRYSTSLYNSDYKTGEAMIASGLSLKAQTTSMAYTVSTSIDTNKSYKYVVTSNGAVLLEQLCKFS